METKNKNKKKYFLILILAIFITAIIAYIVVNLPKEVAQANNAKRKQDIILIINALHKYTSAHRGQLPADIIPNKITEISTYGADICSALVPHYISALPIDPTIKNTIDDISNCNYNYTSGYYLLISKDSKQIKIIAEQAELNEQISLSD